MPALINPENFVSSPIEDGDAGIVLKPDGTFQIFSTGDMDPENLTEEQKAQALKLTCLALALASEDIMDMLARAVADPALDGLRVNYGNKH